MSSRSLFILALALSLMGCVNLDPAAYRLDADRRAAAAGWIRLPLVTERFVLIGYAPATVVPGDELAIYFEGDGQAWLGREFVSPDPTPREPVGLELALRHAPGRAAYLARPCQYVQEAQARGCELRYWTERRFAPEVVASTQQAIDTLKNRFGARRLTLIGYSGGGGLAALVAAGRGDVARLVTVAGNLDHRAWTELHRVTPLAGSLNPADAWAALVDLPQTHFIGARDGNVTRAVAESYAARFPSDRRPAIVEVPEYDHDCCWVGGWPALIQQAAAGGNR